MIPGILASSKPPEDRSVWLGMIAAQWMDDHHSDEWMGAQAFDHFSTAVQAGWAGWGGSADQALDWLASLQGTLNKGFQTHIDLVSGWTPAMNKEDIASHLVDAIREGCSNELEFAKAAGAVADAMRGGLVAFSPDGLRSFEGLFRAAKTTAQADLPDVSSSHKCHAP